ncbi:ankyrin repeat protein [Cordyceps javanica]|uniref:Ankyrin repeat protein n=1 Tax=Cordyceps javanica TaxID=43265 RepID=A0A545UQB8_9HYPO|nr:ankyrin repeat protein [Cordyceps javanica]TQW03567.1 ankyrin repeat protein [Cordyceps javanica]
MGKEDEANRFAEKHGLFRLHPAEHDSYDAIDYQTDIVALHGLGGHAFKTWTNSDGHLWLRDSLPSHVPRSRIMTYGYDSSFKFSSSRAKIVDFASELATRLDLERGHVAERHRPLIFICHSLGGVVFKELLITLSLQTERYQNLAKSVSGVIFLGCPHRGSRIASTAQLLSKIINAATLGRGVRTDLLKALERSSEQLQEISRKAVRLLAPLTIVSFYETRLTNKAYIVEPASAILELPNEHVMPLNADHRELARYSPSSPQRYLPVWKFIQRLVEDASPSLAQDNRLLLNALTSWELKLAKIRPAKARPGTCRWIFTSTVYNRWIRHKKPSMLLLTGTPGCGKSVTTRYIADHLTSVDHARASTSYVVISYFCSYVEAASDAEVMMLRSLLYQLVQHKPESGNIIWNHLATNPGQSTKLTLELGNLWGALIDVLSMHSTTHVCLVLDAVEELGNDIAKSVLKKLDRMTVWLGDKQPNSRLKLFISSRRSFSESNINCELLRMRAHDTNSDIKAYLDQVIEEFAQENVSFNSSTSQSMKRKISESILKSSNGTFLVAVLSWENFRQATRWSQKLVQKNLKSIMPLMSSMEGFYDKMLLKADEDALADAEIVFSILGTAARPLTEEELEEVAGMCLAGKNIRKSTNFSPFRNLVQVMESRFPGLITVQENRRVTLIHRSFKDYLDNNHKDHQSMKMEPRYLIRACLQYLQLRDLIRDARSGLTRYELLELYPLLDYASNYVFWHIESVHVRDPLWLLFANSAETYSLYTLQALQARGAAVDTLSPLQFALERLPAADMLSLISRFHDHGYDLNESWSRLTCGRPLQHCCANAKQPEKLRAASLLLDLGANPSLPEYPFKSNIVRAMQNEAWELYDRLLHHPMTEPNDRDHRNKGLLHHLTSIGSMTRISQLIDTLHDVDVNIQDEDGYTPLHTAIFSNNVDLVRELLRVPGIRLELTDHAGRTPLSTATYWGLKKMALVLIEHPAAFKVVDKDRSSPLIAAAIHGDETMCKRLLQACHYKNIASHQDVSGKRLIHHLAINEWGNMITDCLQRAYPLMSVDAIDHAGRSSLHYASLLGNIESCAALIDADASLKLQDRTGRTAAHVAADSGFKDALMLLLRTGRVDGNQRDHLGRNLVHWAATLDCLDVVHELSRQKDIRWAQRDNYGKQPVDIAYICQSKYVGQFLARKTPNPKQYDWESMYNSPFVDPPPEGDHFEPHVFGRSLSKKRDPDWNGAPDDPERLASLQISKKRRAQIPV